MATADASVSAAAIVRRLRGFLLATAMLVWTGTIVELLLAEHTDSALQLVPFAVALLGIAAVVAVRLKPTRQTVRGLRIVAVVAIVASLVGAYNHFAANLELEREVHSGTAIAQLIWLSLFGASPLLAPGILALAAALAWAATWPDVPPAKPASI